MDLPLFSGVEPETFDAVCRVAATRKYYRRGEVLFNQGDANSTVFLIKDGSFKLVKMTEDGKDAILFVAAKGEVLGEAALFRDSFHPATAIALEDSRVCAISRRNMERAVRDDQDLALQIIRGLGARLYDTWEQLAELSAGDTRDRVLSLLLRLAAEHGIPCPEGTRIGLRLTQQDMADFIGASRVMVARVLRDLISGNRLLRQGQYYVLRDRCF
jgi:CRP/FNR family transcriptional regulator